MPITTKVVSSNLIHGDVIKFVSDLRQVGGFLGILRFSSTNKTDRHDITEIITFPEHPCVPSVFSGVHVTQYLAFCELFCRSLLVLLAIVLHCLFFVDLRGPGWLNELGSWIT